MPWLPPSVIATLSGTAILAAVYIYLYFQDRDKALGIWAVSWTVYALRFVFMLALVSGIESRILLAGNQLTSLTSGIFLLWGTAVFIGRPLSALWGIAGGIGAVWILVAVGLRLSFMATVLPTFVLLAVIYCWTGIRLLRAAPARGLGYRIAGVTFILWGIHKADYPFLRPVPWFAPWGYLLGALLSFVVALSVLLVYFQKARDDLRRSEQRFRALAEHIHEVFWIVSMDWQTVHYVSPAYEALWGRSCDSLYRAPLSWRDAVVAEDREALEAVIDSIDAADTSPITFPEYRIQRPDGSIRWVFARGFPVADPERNSRRVVGIAEDVTQRKQAEESLKESEALHRTLFQSTPDSITITRVADGLYRYVNDGFCQITGYDRGEVIGRTIFELDLMVDPTDRDRFLEILSRKGAVRDFELRYRIKDGTVLDTLFSANPLRYAGEDCLLAVVKDISSVKRAEAHRRDLETELQRARRREAIGTLAGGIAHNFNNLLGIVLGNAELVMEDLGAENPIAENVEEIMTAGFRARDVVRQLLQFTRADTAEKIPHRLDAIVQEAEELIRASTPSSIEIATRLERNTDAILADPSQIKQVLIHLCANAAQAMESGGVMEIGVRNGEAEKGETGRWVELWVADTGPGIEEGLMERIFDPYFTTKDVGKGAGMGLAVVQGIVGRHDGHIVLERAPKGGTVFRVRFPALDGPKPMGREIEAPRKTESGTILLVDDEPALVKTEAAMLTRLGYRVAPFTDPAEALARFRNDPDTFDLVITDMTMPGMTGDRLAGAIQELRPRLPVVLCTGYSDRMDSKQAHRLGVRACLGKPLEKASLARTVRNILEESRAWPDP